MTVSNSPGLKFIVVFTKCTLRLVNPAAKLFQETSQASGQRRRVRRNLEDVVRSCVHQRGLERRRPSRLDRQPAVVRHRRRQKLAQRPRVEDQSGTSAARNLAGHSRRDDPHTREKGLFATEKKYQAELNLL